MNSDRPYFNFPSSYGGPIYIDTTVDEKEIEQAVQRTRLSRERIVRNTGQKQEANLFLRLPGEIRNKIYDLALGINQDPASNTRVLCRYDGDEFLSEGTSLLCLCKHITAEARSKLETQTTAYIPIMSHWNFHEVVSHINENGNATLPPLQSTAFAGLTSFVHAHLHLHVHHERPLYRQSFLYTSEPQSKIDRRIAYIYGILRQALIIWCTASKQNFSHFNNEGRKRKAIVHLDHLIFDWRNMVQQDESITLKDLLSIMAEDTTTEWEVHYYVYVGQKLWTAYSDAKFLLVRNELNWVRSDFEPFPSIKLVQELYGDRQHMVRRNGTISRSITPSSRLWPTWPEDVPWRVFPEVRSDVAVADSSETE